MVRKVPEIRKQPTAHNRSRVGVFAHFVELVRVFRIESPTLPALPTLETMSMTQPLLLSLVAASLLATPPAPCGALNAKDTLVATRCIESITISGNERTRTEIIERELLFEVGDTLDVAIVAETERNLRRLLYLGDASVSIADRDETSVDVSVIVQDLYSRALSPLFSGEAGELSYGLVALDYNVLGRGQIVQIKLNHDPVSGNRVSIAHRLPRLTEARLALASNFAAATEGHDMALSLSRRYHSLSTRWSYGASLSSHESISRLYSSQALTARYRNASEHGSTWIRHSFSRGKYKLRTSLSITIQDRRFETTHGFAYAPADRRRVLTSVGATLWQPRYRRARYVQQLGRLEDLQVGSRATVRAALSHRGLGSDTNFPVVSAFIGPRVVIGQSTFAFTSFSISSRIENGQYQNLLTSTQLRTYHRVHELHSIALRFMFDTVSRPEDSAQFLLGVDRGLRGYEPRSLDGSRRLILNLEARPTFVATPDYVLAAAVFVDAGSAWSPLGMNPDMHTAVGAGFRLGLPRVYSTPVIRIDVARGRVWQLSAAIGQYF